MGKEAATRTYIRLAAASVVGGAAVAYGLWSYWKDLRSPVELCYSPSTNNEEIVKGCPLLQGTYWPSPWMFSAHLQGVALMKLRVSVDPMYRREQLIASDGATLHLDWGESEGPELDPTSPIVLLLSGTTGSSKSSYICHLMCAIRSRGWRPVCMNYQGLTEEPMTSPRFFCIDSVSDIELFVNHVHALFPQAPLFAIGFSIGGHFFLKYLQETLSSPLQGLVALSSPFSLRAVDESWKGRWINEKVYDRHFLDKFKGGVLKNRELFSSVEEVDVEEIAKAKTMQELHLCFTLPLCGLQTIDEYYDSNESARVEKLKVPTLILHAWDDPVVPPNAIPVDRIAENPHLILATTKAGGHTGWLDGLFPFSGLAWCERVTLEYLDALHRSHQALQGPEGGVTPGGQ